MAADGQDGLREDRQLVEEAMAALGRAERFVADVEGRDIDPETAMPNYAHAPAIATARADLGRTLQALQAKLDTATEALESIAYMPDNWTEGAPQGLRGIARAALARLSAAEAREASVE